MKKTSAGPEGSFDAGKIYDVDIRQARELVSGGYAEYLKPPKQKLHQENDEWTS